MGRDQPVQVSSIPEVVIHCKTEFLLATKVALSRLNRRMPQQKLNLLKLTSRQMAQSRAGPAQVMGSKVRDARRFAAAFTTCQIALGVILSPQILPMRLTLRKMTPSMPAALVH